MPKSSSAVPLLIVPALAASCGGPTPALAAVDPCEPSSYVAAACETAIARQGYYFDGVFYPHRYLYPFSYYSSGYDTYIVRGGRVNSVGAAHYGAVGSGGAVAAPSGPTTRGGFGSSGAAHASAGE